MKDPQKTKAQLITELRDLRSRLALRDTDKPVSETPSGHSAKAQADRYAHVFQCNPAIIGLCDRETGRYLDANQAFYDKLGFTKEEIIGKKATEVTCLDAKFCPETMANLDNRTTLEYEYAVIFTK